MFCILLKIALIDILMALNIVPEGIVGHSTGEISCAYADGCLTREQALLAAYWRGYCVRAADIPDGAMAAVGEFQSRGLTFYSCLA